MEPDQHLFLVWNSVTRGYPAPSTAGTLPTGEEMLGTQMSCQQSPRPPAQLGQDSEPGQADLSQGN